MRTFLAIVRDTLLSLRRRRLFWLHLWVSIAVVVLYGGIACTDKGWSLGYGLKVMDTPLLKQGTPWETTLYCWTMARVMRWWVAGGSLFLVLFGTAAILPETLTPGSAALLVPRVPGRGLLLAGRFFGSLIYALIHTVVVVGGLWLALGLRLGVWHDGLWLAVPLVALLFAPLQAVAMLTGALTRSGTAALLVAILFAGSVWALQEAASAPDTESAGAVEDRDTDNGSGLGEGMAAGVVQTVSAVLPPSRDSLVWLERRACPLPPKPYRELFRRLRYGHRGSIGAAAADVIYAASNTGSSRKEREESVRFHLLLLSSAGFTLVVTVLAAWMLKRRDL